MPKKEEGNILVTANCSSRRVSSSMDYYRYMFIAVNFLLNRFCPYNEP